MMNLGQIHSGGKLVKLHRCLAAFFLVFTAASVQAEEVPTCRYYLLLFGGQADILRPTTAHVWGTYVKATCRPGEPPCIETVTISWLPATKKVRVLALQPEVGRNFTLAETLEIISGPRSRIALWGPYEISECRYNQAVERQAVLNSGAIAYKLTDRFNSRPTVEHCLHGLTGAHPDVHERCRVVFRWGEWGTALVASAMQSVGMIAEPHPNHDWLLPLLGLDQRALIRHAAGDLVLIPR